MLEEKDYKAEAEQQIHHQTLRLQDPSGQVVPGTVYDDS